MALELLNSRDIYELEGICARCGIATGKEESNFVCVGECNPRRTLHYQCCGQYARDRNPFRCNDCCIAITPEDLGIPEPPNTEDLPPDLHVVMGIQGRRVLLKTSAANEGPLATSTQESQTNQVNHTSQTSKPSGNKDITVNGDPDPNESEMLKLLSGQWF